MGKSGKVEFIIPNEMFRDVIFTIYCPGISDLLSFLE